MQTEIISHWFEWIINNMSQSSANGPFMSNNYPGQLCHISGSVCNFLSSCPFAAEEFVHIDYRQNACHCGYQRHLVFATFPRNTESSLIHCFGSLCLDTRDFYHYKATRRYTPHSPPNTPLFSSTFPPGQETILDLVAASHSYKCSQFPWGPEFWKHKARVNCNEFLFLPFQNLQLNQWLLGQFSDKIGVRWNHKYIRGKKTG